MSIDEIWKHGTGIGTLQWEKEFKEYLRLVQMANARTIMEIGYWRGGTLWMQCAASPACTTAIGIDLYAGRHADWMERLHKEFSPAIDLHLLTLDAHYDSTLDEVRGILAGREIDVLFLDNGHEYDQVRSNLRMYAPLVRSGGIIAIHDIVVNRERISGRFGGYDTDVVWDEVKTGGEFNGKYIDVAITPSQPCSGHGIGVIIVGEGPKA